jgi:hypothetical protein
MINAPLLVYALEQPLWKLMIMLGFVVAGTICAMWRFHQERSLVFFILGASIGASAFLMVATAFGRAKETAWVPGLEMHYGSLAILLPITAWIALSSTLPRRIGAVAGIVLVLLFARAYWANYQWREYVVEADKIPNSIAQAAIMGREDPTVVAATYITRYFYIDTPHTRSVVAAGINILRNFTSL